MSTFARRLHQGDVIQQARKLTWASSMEGRGAKTAAPLSRYVSRGARFFEIATCTPETLAAVAMILRQATPDELRQLDRDIAEHCRVKLLRASAIMAARRAHGR